MSEDRPSIQPWLVLEVSSASDPTDVVASRLVLEKDSRMRDGDDPVILGPCRIACRRATLLEVTAHLFGEHDG